MGRKILFVITDLEIGGTPSVVRELATRLRSDEVQTAVACIAPWGPVVGEIVARGIKVHELGARWPWQFPRVVRDLARIARDYDTVFSLLMHANVCCAVSSHFWGDAKFYQSIQTTQPYPRWHWWLQGMVHRSAQKIAVPSQSVANVAYELSHVPYNKTVVIPNAIEVDRFMGIARKSNYPNERFRVGFIGRLDPVKRVPDLVAALAQLPQTELHIYGDGEDRPAIAAKIEEVDVSHRVILHGTVPAPFDALSSIDVLVLPSEAEGFGLVLVEAMAAGIPVIATDVPGIRDVIKHNETGLLVPMRNPDQLAAAIIKIRDDVELRNKLCANALKEAQTRYTWDGVLEQYRKLLGL